MSRPPDTQKPAGRGRASHAEIELDDAASIGRGTRGVNEADDPRRDAVLADLRRAHARIRLWQVEVDAIGLCLREGLIDTQRALDEMRDLGIPILMDAMVERRPGDSRMPRHAA